MGSTSDVVLKNIKRKRIKMATYWNLQARFNETMLTEVSWRDQAFHPASVTFTKV
jgi:hypothetical protein